MARRSFLLLLAAVTLLALLPWAGPVMAQGGTKSTPDPLNPVGPLPWSIPSMPLMISPTPYRLRPTPTPAPITPTPSATPTPTMTPTATVSMSGEHQSAATLAASGADGVATVQAISNPSLQIEDRSLATAAAEVGQYSAYFWGYAKGLQLFNIRGTGGVVGFLLLAAAFLILVNVFTAVLPFVAVLARWTMEMLQLIAEFLPF